MIHQTSIYVNFFVPVMSVTVGVGVPLQQISVSAGEGISVHGNLSKL